MIGYYVHHQGRGHLHRARSIAAALGDDVVGVSSLPAEGGPFADWVVLPPDDLAADPADRTAQGMLHWAPLRDGSSAHRVAALTGWVAAARPRAVVVDVSVEAAVAVRLAGAPVIVIAQPGDRGDRAHQLGYGLAAGIVACWPREVYDPGWLRPYHDRTTFVGALSRYDDRVPAPTQDDLVVLLGGAGGGWGGTADVGSLEAVAAATPGWRWQSLPGTDGRLVDDPWSTLSAAGVVVTHAGQNALAEVAAARRPALVIPQDRPFGEQRATAAALHHASIAQVTDSWPESARWAALLADVRQLDPGRWARWSTGDAAARAAAAIGAVAAGGAAW